MKKNEIRQLGVHQGELPENAVKDWYIKTVESRLMQMQLPTGEKREALKSLREHWRQG